MSKKITRKQFLLTIFSFSALLVASKVPNVIRAGVPFKKDENSYGNYSYGGKKKNV